jgi:hypothetical protein
MLGLWPTENNRSTAELQSIMNNKVTSSCSSRRVQLIFATPPPERRSPRYWGTKAVQHDDASFIARLHSRSCNLLHRRMIMWTAA